MKNNDWKILIASIAYTFLFYQQSAGLNYLIFGLLMVFLSLLQNTQNAKKIAWWAVALGTLISGFMVFRLGTNLPILAHIISLFFLAGLTFKSNTSLLLAGFNSITSFVLTLPVLVFKFFKRKPQNENTKTSLSLFKRLLLLMFPLFVVFIFFILYQDSNPLFLKFTEKINLDWFNFAFIKHFLFGLLLMYAFFVQRIIQRFNRFDENTTDNIPHTTEAQHQQSFFARFISLPSEAFTALALLLMLNVLIAFLNGIDIYFLWLKNPLPQGLVFSNYLHSGTFALIVSILLAIAIIVFFFRGIFNFSPQGKKLKWLGFLWVAQNVVMIVSAMLRNQLYIAQYGMTHKRIGVYVFLLLALIGLVFTLVKIATNKNFWFLLRKNAWAYYAVLIVACFFDWDNIITEYNIKLANKNYIVDLDKNYLDRLSHTNTALLLLQDTNYLHQYNIPSYSLNSLDRKLYHLLEYQQRNHWKEKCYSKDKNLERIQTLNESKRLKQLNLYGLYLEKLPLYHSVNQIQNLNLYSNRIGNRLKNLAFYTQLEKLNVGENNISSLDSLPTLAHLNALDISQNQIEDYKALSRLPLLEELNISNNPSRKKAYRSFPVLAHLQTLNLSQTHFTDWSFLGKQPQLKKITFTHSTIKNYFPVMPHLEEIYLQSSQLYYSDGLDSLAGSKNIKIIDLTACSVNGLDLLDYNNRRPLFKKLETLLLASNNLSTGDLKNIAKYTHLQTLDISTNNLRDIQYLTKMKSLTSLHIGYNKLKDIKPLASLKKLKHLDISSTNTEDLSELYSLVQLESLDVRNNFIENIKGIEKLKSLSSLILNQTEIEDISMLPQLKNLEKLYIRNTNIKDFSPLLAMPQLKILSIDGADLATIEKLKKALPNTFISYYSQNLSKNIGWSIDKSRSYVESF